MLHLLLVAFVACSKSAASLGTFSFEFLAKYNASYAIKLANCTTSANFVLKSMPKQLSVGKSMGAGAFPLDGQWANGTCAFDVTPSVGSFAIAWDVACVAPGQCRIPPWPKPPPNTLPSNWLVVPFQRMQKLVVSIAQLS